MSHPITPNYLPGRTRLCRLAAAIFFLTILSLDVPAQNVLDKTGLGSGAPASAAYSFRLLSSSYSGKALRILRTSDNATADIGFTANGDLDTAALKTFVGTANGLVNIWYDQSGHTLDLTQATQANQPVLVNAGTINRENNQPFVRFYGSGTAYNSLNLSAAMTTVGHVSAVMLLMSTGDGFILSYTGGYYWHSNPPSVLINSTYASGSVQGGNGWSNGTAYTPTTIPWPSSLSLDELEPSTPASGTTWDNIGSDRNQYHDISLGGGYGELIVFPTALSTADRQTLETNETSYFSIGTLPVTWLSFTAQPKDGDVLLQWQTAFEQNSKDFTVQYSSNGTGWSNLATLAAAGNSSTTRSYSYINNNPPPGKGYYRIQQTDLDGNNHYSSVDVVEIPDVQGEFRVLQNPVVERLLQLKVYRTTILSLFTIDGKLLWKGQYDPGDHTVRLADYPKGPYVLAGQTTSVQLLLR